MARKKKELSTETLNEAYLMTKQKTEEQLEFIKSLNLSPLLGGVVWNLSENKGISFGSIKKMKNRFMLMNKLYTKTIHRLMDDKNTGIEKIFLLASSMTEEEQEEYYMRINPFTDEKTDDLIGGVKSDYAIKWWNAKMEYCKNLTEDEVLLVRKDYSLNNPYLGWMRNDKWKSKDEA